MKMLKAMKTMKKFWSRKKKRKLIQPDHSSYNYPPPPPPYPPPPPPPCYCHLCQFPPPYPVEPSAPPLPEEEEHLLISSEQELVMIMEETQPQPVYRQQYEYRVGACGGEALMPGTRPRESRVFGFFVRCFLPCFGIEDEREREKKP